MTDDDRKLLDDLDVVVAHLRGDKEWIHSGNIVRQGRDRLFELVGDFVQPPDVVIDLGDDDRVRKGLQIRLSYRGENR
jgi:hypothetical protein